MTNTNKFKATIEFKRVLIPTKTNEGNEIRQSVEYTSTNARNLEVIRLFKNGDLKVSSVTERISKQNGKTAINFDVVFYSQFRSIDLEEIIEKFNEVFVIHSVSEVTKN